MESEGPTIRKGLSRAKQSSYIESYVHRKCNPTIQKGLRQARTESDVHPKSGPTSYKGLSKALRKPQHGTLLLMV